MYEECGDAGLVCRRCGISRPTLLKWAKRLSSMESLVWKARTDALIHLHIPNSMMS